MGKDHNMLLAKENQYGRVSLYTFSYTCTYIHMHAHRLIDSQGFMFDQAMKATVNNFSKSVLCISPVITGICHNLKVFKLLQEYTETQIPTYAHLFQFTKTQ